MKTKFCVLPGSAPVRIATTAGGHVCIIGETPREVPAMFHREAISRGCCTEKQIAALRSSSASISKDVAAQKVGKDLNEDPDGINDGVDMSKIIDACIQIINSGDADLAYSDGGKPKVDAIENIVGFKVTGQQRDLAFKTVMEG